MEAIKVTANDLIIRFFGLTSKHKKDRVLNDGFTNAAKCAIIVCEEIIDQYIDEDLFTARYYKGVIKEIKIIQKKANENHK